MTLKVADNDELVGWISLVAGQGRKIRQFEKRRSGRKRKGYLFQKFKVAAGRVI
jgi:hypothetical protein